MAHNASQAVADHAHEIPETIKTQQLVKDLAKEIRLVEVGWGEPQHCIIRGRGTCMFKHSVLLDALMLSVNLPTGFLLICLVEVGV